MSASAIIPKACDIALKDIDVKQGLVTGYFASFGTVDFDGDIFDQAAFNKSIRENGPDSAKPRIKHLLDHSRTKCVAVIKSLVADNTGLLYVSKATSATQGQDFLKMCEDGIITEHSVGISYIADKIKQDENGNNLLLEVKLWEGSSLQTWGSNSNTPLLGVKSLEELTNYLIIIQKALHRGTYTDEAFIEIEKLYAQIGSIIKDKTTETEAIAPTTQPIEEDKTPIFDREKFYKELSTALKTK